MPRMRAIASTTFVVLAFATTAFAQQPAAGGGQAARTGPPRRPALFFKEEWKQNEKNDEHPVTQASIANADLELKLYGPTGKEIQLTGRPNDENNPTHVWTGVCTSPCALAFRHKNQMADLTGLARLRWNTKMSGFHTVRPIVKLADGTWLVGDRAQGTVTDWIVSEINFSELRWLKLDIERVVTTGNYVANPDLSKVDEIGFADLMPGSGHGAGGWSDVAQFEVYANPVPRSATTTAAR
jgi:hypothetical protein